MTSTVITAETLTASGRISKEFGHHFRPLIEQWVERRLAKGDVSALVIYLGISAELMILSRLTHVGDNALFERMAATAIQLDPDLPGVH